MKCQDQRVLVHNVNQQFQNHIILTKKYNVAISHKLRYESKLDFFYIFKKKSFLIDKATTKEC